MPTQIRQGQISSPVKATGAEITTGTDDAKFSTAKAIADADLNTRLKSKVISTTRDGVGANADVAYTGVGFAPTSLQARMCVNGALFNSHGFGDSARTVNSIQQTAANVYYQSTTVMINYTDQNNWGQTATVKSYDSDGFTLTWAKAGTPTANTMQISIICYK
jgi:hypothetical protein